MRSGYRARRYWRDWVLASALLLVPLAQAGAPPPTTDAVQPRTVLVLGDSLSAAYGLPAAQGWVALTGDRIARSKPGWRVVNASISGETSAGGAARVVDEVIRHRPTVVVIELGANDALQGLPLAQAKRQLARMIGAAHGVGAKVLLVGMRIPPNYGVEYSQQFEDMYSDLAERFSTALLPFLLQPVAGDRDAFQADNLHPVAAAQPKLRDHVWPALEPLLE